jgi:hypothetical protein
VIAALVAIGVITGVFVIRRQKARARHEQVAVAHHNLTRVNVSYKVTPAAAPKEAAVSHPIIQLETDSNLPTQPVVEV